LLGDVGFAPEVIILLKAFVGWRSMMGLDPFAVVEYVGLASMRGPNERLCHTPNLFRLNGTQASLCDWSLRRRDFGSATIIIRRGLGSGCADKGILGATIRDGLADLQPIV
jgi:hypothetical protein